MFVLIYLMNLLHQAKMFIYFPTSPPSYCNLIVAQTLSQTLSSSPSCCYLVDPICWSRESRVLTGRGPAPWELALSSRGLVTIRGELAARPSPWQDWQPFSQTWRGPASNQRLFHWGNPALVCHQGGGVTSCQTQRREEGSPLVPAPPRLPLLSILLPLSTF